MATNRLLRAALLAALVPVAVIAVSAQGHGGGQDRPVPALAAEPPMLGLHWEHGEAGKARPGGGGTSNIVWHKGAIMPLTTVTPIFWGPSWDNPVFVGDKIGGLNSWHIGVGSSTFANTSNEYNGTNGYVTSAINYSGGPLVDLSAVPATVAKLTTPTATEVCKVIGSSAPADGSGYYPVYVDVKRGNAGFCAYHSYATCNNIPVQFAFFFNLDGDAGCDPQDTSGKHWRLAALVNVLATSYPEGAGSGTAAGTTAAGRECRQCAWASPRR